MNAPAMAAAAPGVLVVSADAALAARLGGPLLAAGFSVSWETSPALAGQRLALEQHPLLLLDVPFGRLQEFAELCESRPGSTLLLVAPRETEAGRFPECRLERPAPVASVVEQLQRLRLQRGRSNEATSLQIGPLLLDPLQRAANYGAQGLELTWGEFDLLWLLATNLGRVVPRHELHLAVTGMPYQPSIRSIDVHVSRLRKKLVGAGFRPSGLRAVRGKGYILMGV